MLKLCATPLVCVLKIDTPRRNKEEFLLVSNIICVRFQLINFKSFLYLGIKKEAGVLPPTEICELVLSKCEQE